MPKKPTIYNNEQVNAANAPAVAIIQPEELDVFSGNLIQTSIINEQIVECHPISPLVHMEPIVIECPASYTAMTDPFFLLNITAKVVNGDGKALKADARVAPINLTLHSIFRDAVLKINGTIVSQATGTYPYKALIETTYTYSKQAKEGAVGIPQMFYKETAGKFNALDDGNKGFVARRAKFITSTDVEMMGRLNINVLLQPKLFVPGRNGDETNEKSHFKFVITGRGLDTNGPARRESINYYSESSPDTAGTLPFLEPSTDDEKEAREDSDGKIEFTFEPRNVVFEPRNATSYHERPRIERQTSVAAAAAAAEEKPRPRSIPISHQISNVVVEEKETRIDPDDKTPIRTFNCIVTHTPEHNRNINKEEK